MISPLDNIDVLIAWLESNPDELQRITKLMNDRG